MKTMNLMIWILVSILKYRRDYEMILKWKETKQSLIGQNYYLKEKCHKEVAKSMSVMLKKMMSMIEIILREECSIIDDRDN